METNFTVFIVEEEGRFVGIHHNKSKAEAHARNRHNKFIDRKQNVKEGTLIIREKT